jgi:Protein of unknown function (DUF2934)
MDPLAVRHEEIACLAYHIYEKEGRPEGKSAEHWARAERAIHEQRVRVPRSDGSKATNEDI